MNKELLKQASEVVGETCILVNLVSKRTKQLNDGCAPLVSEYQDLEAEEIALKEIIEGLVYQQKD